MAIAGLPVVLAGYSFGALVALSTRDERITHVIAVAPPLGAGALAPGVPTLVIPPERDQYCPAERAVDITSAWVDTTVAAVPDADHFLGGRTRHVAELATAWIRSQLELTSQPRQNRNWMSEVRQSRASDIQFVERTTGFEPATLTLAR